MYESNILDNDVCINCLIVYLFDEKILKYFRLEKNLLILDLDPDSHSSQSLDPDPHSSQSLDPDPHIMHADPKPCLTAANRFKKSKYESQ
jgi:hypothetical protein